MIDKNVVFDRLSGGLCLYIENYQFQKNNGKIKPSYELSDKELNYLDNHLEEIKLFKENAYNLKNGYIYQIFNCDNIKDLPKEVYSLIKCFLPRFLNQFPEYNDIDCLK